MEILKFAVPAATGLLGVVKLFNRRSPVMRFLTTALIIIGGAGSVVLVQESGKVEERRAVAAEQAQQRAETKLDKMTDALLVSCNRNSLTGRRFSGMIAHVGSMSETGD